MPWTNEINATYTVSDYGPKGTGYDYSDAYAKATLTVKTSGTSLSVNVSMTTTNAPKISMYLKVNGEVLISKTYFDGSSSSFPRKSGSGQAWELSIGEKDTSVPVEFKLLTAQDFTGDSTRFENAPTINKTPTRIYYTNIGTGTTTITDNNNNSFTIKATKGASGTNNTAGGPTNLNWGYDTKYNGTYTNGAVIALTRSGTGDTRTIYAKSTTTATYGDDKIASASKAIKQYLQPSSPGAPTLAANKKTLKESWKYTWTASTKGNNTSPVKGYRIRIFKNGEAILGLTCSTANSINTITGKGANTSKYIDIENTNCNIVFTPETLGFVAGDKVKVGIYAYSRNGKNEQEWSVTATDSYNLFSGGGKTENRIDSVETVIKSAGIMQTKIGGTWREGQVYVKIGGTWREAETVHTKIGGTWREAN